MNVLDKRKESQRRQNYIPSVDRDFLLDQARSVHQNFTPQYQVASRETTPYLPGFREFKSMIGLDRPNRIVDYVDVPHDSDQTCNAANIPASFFQSIVVFRSIVESISRTLNATWDQTLPVAAHRKVRGAPDWLLQRMEAVRQMPRPTLEEVRTQLKASAEVQRKFDDKRID
jgi:hypothetical protein